MPNERSLLPAFRREFDHQIFPTQLENGIHLLARHGWKLFQHLGNAVIAIQVIKKRLHRHSRATEARRATHDFSIDLDRRIDVIFSQTHTTSPPSSHKPSHPPPRSTRAPYPCSPAPPSTESSTTWPNKPTLPHFH